MAHGTWVPAKGQGQVCRSSCAAEGRVSIVYAGGRDCELRWLWRIGRSERATRILAQHDRIAPMETPEVV
jgi:hypothetical protein